MGAQMPTMTADEVAAMFHSSKDTILRYARDPERRRMLGAFKFGGKWLFKRDKVQEFIESCGKEQR